MTVRLFSITVLTIFFAASTVAQSKAIVTNSNASLRSKPSSKGSVKFKVKKNSLVNINKKKSRKGWRFVSIKNKTGWIDTDDLRILLDDSQRRAVWLEIGRSPEAKGFSLRYYLNASQIVRNGNSVHFWIKIIPSNSRAYLKFLKHRTAKRAADFNHNLNLMQGNCSSKRLKITKLKLYWTRGRIENARIAKPDMKAADGTAAKILLSEACKIGKRL